LLGGVKCRSVVKNAEQVYVADLKDLRAH